LPSGNEWGTIRLALDIQPFIDARRLLLNSLLLSGFVIALAVTLFSLMILRRTMRPLQVLAKEAVEIDPANPRLTSYVGPEDEVATLARALDRTLEAIRERQQAERDALAEIAHELAAPLSVVSGQLNSLAGDKTSDVRFLAARDAANELLYSSQDLLTLARGELDFKFELSALDLLQVAERVANEYPGVKVLGSSVEVLASYERMVQVVRNLVRNAVQASGSPDKVTVRLEASGSQTLLHVQDRGPGLSDDVKAHLFERYYSRKQGGTGVGLVVARNIIEQHEGTIEVSSTLGEGSCFTVRLPSLEAQLEDSDTIQDEP
jgi:signal transduction histidine kinase